MAKNEGLSCPLCLTANDPADMLGVTIEHAVPVPNALVGLCKRCVLVIVKSAMSAEFIEPSEIFGEPGEPPNYVGEGDAAPRSPVPRFDGSSDGCQVGDDAPPASDALEGESGVAKIAPR